VAAPASRGAAPGRVRLRAPGPGTSRAHLQTNLYTPAAQAAQPHPIVLVANRRAQPGGRLADARGLRPRVLNYGAPTDATPLADMVSDVAASAAAVAAGPMVDALELLDMVEGFRDDAARRKLQAMPAARRRRAAPRPPIP